MLKLIYKKFTSIFFRLITFTKYNLHSFVFILIYTSTYICGLILFKKNFAIFVTDVEVLVVQVVILFPEIQTMVNHARYGRQVVEEKTLDSDMKLALNS